MAIGAQRWGRGQHPIRTGSLWTCSEADNHARNTSGPKKLEDCGGCR
jgi:hypothetical protein